MNAAIVTAAGKSPIYGKFADPSAREGMEIITVTASALSQLTKARATGAHYSSESIFPSVAGVDGVGLTQDGRRVYFALPEAPYGALAEKTLVRTRQCIPIPDTLDDVTAAALANPGMSSWAAFVERAHLKRGETVLINGATGSAGQMAVQVAKYLGASRVIVTGRNEGELQSLLAFGAGAVIPFSLGASNPAGAKQYEEALIVEFSRGIDVVIDYLWGTSAVSILTAITKTVESDKSIRFVQIGAASREDPIALPSAALRSSVVQLMGSGLKSVPLPKLLEAVGNVFEAAGPAKLQVAVRAMPLSEIAEAWAAPNKPRVVVTMR